MCIPVGLKLPMLHSWPILPLTSRPRPQPSWQQDSYVITPRPIRPNSSPRPSILLNPLGSIGSIRPCQSLWAAALSHPACVFLLLQPEHSVQMLLWDKDTTHKLYKETLCFGSCTATQPQPNDGRTCSLLVGSAARETSQNSRVLPNSALQRHHRLFRHINVSNIYVLLTGIECCRDVS